MHSYNLFGINISMEIAITVILFVWITVLLFIKRLSFKAMQKFAANTKTDVDDIFIKSADFPLTLIIITSGVAFVSHMIPNAAELPWTNQLLLAFKATTIVAIILFVDRFLNSVLYGYQDKIDVLRSTGGLVRVIVRVVVISLGVLILLDSFGVSITPLIASLGIGSLAVALALQPTLENFFAGIQIAVDKPFQIGHFIKIDSGEEGYVHKIGWRCTWLRFRENNILIVQNKTLVNSRITNYYYPDKEVAVLVQVGVHYNSNLEHVEKVTIDVAKKTLKEAVGAVADFEPFIRYHTFDSSSINFTVILRAQEITDNFLIKHEFIKALHKRFAQEGIVIPYPIRAINYDQEKQFEKKS